MWRYPQGSTRSTTYRWRCGRSSPWRACRRRSSRTTPRASSSTTSSTHTAASTLSRRSCTSRRRRVSTATTLLITRSLGVVCGRKKARLIRAHTHAHYACYTYFIKEIGVLITGSLLDYLEIRRFGN